MCGRLCGHARGAGCAAESQRAARLLQTGEDAVELVRGLEARMKAAIQDLRTEFLQKLSVVTNEITQMQKQINVQKGEGNILAQQNKEANRRILEVAEQVQELSLELLGDPVGAAGAAHAP